MTESIGVMPVSPLIDLKIDDWNKAIDINIRGVLHGIAAVLPHMSDRQTNYSSSQRSNYCKKLSWSRDKISDCFTYIVILLSITTKKATTVCSRQP